MLSAAKAYQMLCLLCGSGQSTFNQASAGLYQIYLVAICLSGRLCLHNPMTRALGPIRRVWIT